MNSFKRGGWSAKILRGVLLLTGCSGPVNVTERVKPGLPTPLTVAQESTISVVGPSAIWLEPGSCFALITFGSSSCPDAVTALDAVDAHNIGPRLERTGGNGPCTTDLAPTTRELTLPESVSGHPVNILVTYAESSNTTALVLD